MNERIRELVGQAKFMAEETINKQISKNAELDAFAEKFAELIINQCIKCCGEIDDINKVYREGLFLDPELGPKECINTIKEHFGVEE